MSDSSRIDPDLILPEGTQVVIRTDVAPIGGGRLRPQGTTGVIVQAPTDHTHAYRVRFPDGTESCLKRPELAILKHFQGIDYERSEAARDADALDEHVIYRCIVGSHAYGLAHEASDIDRRGIYLPPAHRHWSLYGVPDQLEKKGADEVYWELQKFLILALKANPNILECLYTPRVEFASDLARELLEMRDIFLSQLVYQTYNRYVMSQFKKFQRRLAKGKELNWKHAMHLIRLLQSGITILREGFVPVDVSDQRDELMAIAAGERSWEEIDARRRQLHAAFDEAFADNDLPARPDYGAANDFLIRARRHMACNMP